MFARSRPRNDWCVPAGAPGPDRRPRSRGWRERRLPAEPFPHAGSGPVFWPLGGAGGAAPHSGSTWSLATLTARGSGGCTPREWRRRLATREAAPRCCCAADPALYPFVHSWTIDTLSADFDARDVPESGQALPRGWTRAGRASAATGGVATQASFQARLAQPRALGEAKRSHETMRA